LWSNAFLEQFKKHAIQEKEAQSASFFTVRDRNKKALLSRAFLLRSFRDNRENKVSTICKTGFGSAQPSMAERSRSHITWYSNLLLLT